MDVRSAATKRSPRAERRVESVRRSAARERSMSNSGHSSAATTSRLCGCPVTAR